MAKLAHVGRIATTRDARGNARRKLHLQVETSALGSRDPAASIYDLSENGMLVETAADLAVGDVFEIDLPDGQPKMAEVIWRRNSLLGCKLSQPMSTAAVSAALLRGSFDQPVPDAPRGGDDQEVMSDLAQSSIHLEAPVPELSPRARLGLKVGAALITWLLIGGIIVLIVR